MTDTSNKAKSLAPAEQMREAFVIWKFLLCIMACVQQNIIDFSNLPREYIFKSRTGSYKLDMSPLSRGNFEIISRNSLIAGTSLCVIAFDKAMDIAFGSKDNRFPTDNNDLESARAIIYQIRNAFAHDPLHPSWHVTKEKYLKRFQIGEIKLEVNLCDLNGTDFQVEHVGGDPGLFLLLEYCIKQVERKSLANFSQGE